VQPSLTQLLPTRNLQNLNQLIVEFRPVVVVMGFLSLLFARDVSSLVFITYGEFVVLKSIELETRLIG
jgi:hypothetical protein